MPKEIDVRSLDGSSVVLSSHDRGYFPVVQRIGNREAIAVIRGGAGHIGLGGRLELIRTKDQGKTWSEPMTIADSEWDDRNPAVGMARDGTLVLSYHHQGNYDGDGRIRPGERVDTLLKTSNDNGGTWSDPFPLSYTALNGRSPYGRMINIGSTLLMPIYGNSVGKPKDFRESVSYILRSVDSGRTWDDLSLVAEEMNETSFVNLPDGGLLAILRSAKDHPDSLYSSLSKDDGYTWTEPVRITEDSEHPGDIILLSNGWLLLVFGHRHPPHGVQGMVSTDSGRTWESDKRLIFADDRPAGDCGYPSVTIFPNGRMFVMYYSASDRMDTWDGKGSFSKAVLFDEDELVSALENA